MKTKQQELELIIAEAQAQLELLKNANWEGRLSQGDFGVSLGKNGFEQYNYHGLITPKHSFTTKDRADLFAKKITLFLEMTNFAHVMNESWVADWSDGSQKWGVRQFDGVIAADYYYSANSFCFGIAVKDPATAELMLAEFGERLTEIYNLPC